MSEPSDAASELRSQAAQFAFDLTNTVRAVAGENVAEFRARGGPNGAGNTTRLTVRQEPDEGIVLHVGGSPLLVIKVSMHCVWDSTGAYLAVDESFISVTATGTREPLFRFEFTRDAHSVPSAHLQVHGHRDALASVMTRAGQQSGRARRRAGAVAEGSGIPTMSELHFPLGGQRFRPCLEDVLGILVDELGVDAPESAAEALADGRERWRRMQLAAAVRDGPETAAATLQSLGYTVQPPPAGPVPDRVDKLRAL